MNSDCFRAASAGWSERSIWRVMRSADARRTFRITRDQTDACPTFHRSILVPLVLFASFPPTNRSRLLAAAELIRPPSDPRRAPADLRTECRADHSLAPAPLPPPSWGGGSGPGQTKEHHYLNVSACLIHFPASLLPPEAEVDNVGEKATGALHICHCTIFLPPPLLLHPLHPHDFPNFITIIGLSASSE